MSTSEIDNAIALIENGLALLKQRPSEVAAAKILIVISEIAARTGNQLRDEFFARVDQRFQELHESR